MKANGIVYLCCNPTDDLSSECICSEHFKANHINNKDVQNHPCNSNDHTDDDRTVGHMADLYAAGYDKHLEGLRLLCVNIWVSRGRPCDDSGIGSAEAIPSAVPRECSMDRVISVIQENDVMRDRAYKEAKIPVSS